MNRSIDISQRLGFGCARLFRSPSSKERQRILETAYECGIRYFDVARMYGLGEAESEVGIFQQSKSGNVKIATKFGIPLQQSSLLRRLGQTYGRRIIRWFPSLRKQVASPSQRFYKPKDFSIAFAESSLNESLKELRTDTIDAFFLHEPTNQDDVPSEISNWLGIQRGKGTIRSYGVSGKIDETILAENVRRYQWPLLQFEYHPLLKDKASHSILHPGEIITFGALSGAVTFFNELIRADSGFENEFLERFGGDPKSGIDVPAVLIRNSLETYPHSRALFSTSRVDRLKGIVERVQSLPWDHDTCQWLCTRGSRA